MSLFHNTVTLFGVISLVSCVSSFTATPTEVTAVKEVAVKDNEFYDIIMSELLQRVNMDYIDEEQKTVRIKKTLADMEVARLMPPFKLLKLIVLAFRNLLSRNPIEGDPALHPHDVANTSVKILQNHVVKFRWKQPKPTAKR